MNTTTVSAKNMAIIYSAVRQSPARRNACRSAHRPPSRIAIPKSPRRPRRKPLSHATGNRPASDKNRPQRTTPIILCYVSVDRTSRKGTTIFSKKNTAHSRPTFQPSYAPHRRSFHISFNAISSLRRYPCFCRTPPVRRPDRRRPAACRPKAVRSCPAEQNSRRRGKPS